MSISYTRYSKDPMDTENKVNVDEMDDEHLINAFFYFKRKRNKLLQENFNSIGQDEDVRAKRILRCNVIISHLQKEIKNRNLFDY